MVSSHQVRVDSLEPGATTREMTRARARSRARPAGPSRAGSPSLAAIACTAATCPCGSDPVMVTACPAGTSRSPFSVASIAATACVRQRRQVGQRLVPDLAAVAVGPAHQHRLIHPLLAGLRHIRALVPGYVHRAAAYCHTTILARNTRERPERHANFVATSDSREHRTSACQSSNLYVELRQLRAKRAGSSERRRPASQGAGSGQSRHHGDDRCRSSPTSGTRHTRSSRRRGHGPGEQHGQQQRQRHLGPQPGRRQDGEPVWNTGRSTQGDFSVSMGQRGREPAGATGARHERRERGAHGQPEPAPRRPPRPPPQLLKVVPPGGGLDPGGRSGTAGTWPRCA